MRSGARAAVAALGPWLMLTSVVVIDTAKRWFL